MTETDMHAAEAIIARCPDYQVYRSQTNPRFLEVTPQNAAHLNKENVDVHLSDYQIDIDPARHPPDKVYTPWKGEFPVITWEFAPFGRREWKYLVRRLDGQQFSRKVQHNIARREARAQRRREAKRG